MSRSRNALQRKTLEPINPASPALASIGAHLYIFNKTDWEAKVFSLLADLRGAGYAGFEAFLRVPTTAEQLADLQMPLWAAHLRPVDLADPNALLERLRLLGTHDICSSGLLEWNERTPDDYQRTAHVLNEAGRVLRRHGVYLHYHNHDFEFTRWENGLCGMDVLLQHLDPDAASLCLDLGWLHVAGYDTISWMNRYAHRVGFIHLRDFAGTASVALGRGDVPIAEQITAIAQMPHVRRVVVEQDPDTPTPINDMIASRVFLREQCGL